MTAWEQQQKSEINLFITLVYRKPTFNLVGEYFCILIITFPNATNVT